MESNFNPWKKSCERTIDQRDVPLPPTWLKRAVAGRHGAELGRRVHKSGRSREVARLLITLLDHAREKAVVSSYLLAEREVEDAIMRAATRGVRVYVLLASETRLGRDESEDAFEKRVLAQHKEMLARLGGHVLFRSSPHFHAKMVLVDPEEHPRGVLLTANLTTEALERNEELTVELSPREVHEAAALARWAMWESAEHELVDPEDRFRAVAPLKRVAHPQPGSCIAATTSDAAELRESALAVIDSAALRIIVSSFGWGLEHAVVQRLCARAREGVEVTVLARVREKPMPALVELARAGARVLGFRWLHAKAIWADTGRALVMSANLEQQGLDHGFEIGVRLEDDRAVEVQERLEAWSSAAPWELHATPALGEADGEVKVWHGGRLVDVVVSPLLEVSLGAVSATSAEDLVAPEPPLPTNGALPRPAHRILRTWSVEAPKLAAKSKEIRRPPDGEKRTPMPYSPPVFREPSGRLVVGVRSPDELDVARLVKSEVGAAAIVVADGIEGR